MEYIIRRIRQKLLTWRLEFFAWKLGVGRGHEIWKTPIVLEVSEDENEELDDLKIDYRYLRRKLWRLSNK